VLGWVTAISKQQDIYRCDSSPFGYAGSVDYCWLSGGGASDGQLTIDVD
jgi:hypothetical protein